MVVWADPITDCSPDIDLLQQEVEIFTALTTVPGNAFDAGKFQFGVDNAARNSDVRIVYNTNMGAFYYDADGSGTGVAVKIAVLEGAPP